MAILHGSWLIPSRSQAQQAAGTLLSDRALTAHGSLFLWGEVWRRIEPELLATESAGAQSGAQSEVQSGTQSGIQSIQVEKHPFAMSPLELSAFLRSRQQSRNLRLPESFLAPLTEPATATAKTGRAKQGAAMVMEAPATLVGIWQTRTLAIPSYAIEEGEWDLPAGTIVPQHSAATDDPAATDDRDCFLHPWTVEGLHLDAIDALTFLNSLPLGTVDADDSFLSGDLRFWSHTARWSLDLLARSKFLPGLEREEREQGGRGSKLAGRGGSRCWMVRLIRRGGHILSIGCH